LALLATLGITYMGVARGLHRTGLALMAWVLAAVIAFGLMGPLTGLGPVDTRSGAWYYGGDAFVLWAVFGVAFFAIREFGDRLTPVEAKFSLWTNRIGGGLLGAIVGYLTVGLCILLVQMLPTPPDFLGYEAFRFEPLEKALKSGHAQPGARSDVITRGDTLWLAWDRGTLGLINFITGGALGSESSALAQRYGDAYPPLEMREAGYRPAFNADDILYTHWFRRWEFAGATDDERSPMHKALKPTSDSRGLILKHGETFRTAGLDLILVSVRPHIEVLAGFPTERPPADHEFLIVGLRFQPNGSLPATVDSAQFCLRLDKGDRFILPMIFGDAKGGTTPEPDLPPTASDTKLREVRFGSMPTNEGITQQFYLASGATFEFRDPSQSEIRFLVFSVPKGQKIEADFIRLTAETKPMSPPAPAKAAPTATGKAAPSATGSAAPTATKSGAAATPSAASKTAPAAATSTGR
jgi:hypothetical protein